MLKRNVALFQGILFILFIVTGCSAKPPDTSFDVAVDGLYSGALSADANAAVIGSLNHGGAYWQLNPKERLFNWNHSADAASVITASALSPDGRYAMTAEQQTMVLWDTQTGEDITYWRAPANIEAIALSNNTDKGVLAALALDNHTAVIFNASFGRIVREFLHQQRVRSVAISADGTTLLSGAEDHQSIYWSITEGVEISRHSHSDEVRLSVLSADLSLAFSVSKYDKATVWQTADGQPIGNVPILGDALRRGRTFSAARFSADNRMLVTGSSDRMVQLWRLPQLEEVARWELPKRSSWQPAGSAVLDVGFNNTNDVVAIASNGIIHHMNYALVLSSSSLR
jgi:WD40 repeat protein